VNFTTGSKKEVHYEPHLHNRSEGNPVVSSRCLLGAHDTGEEHVRALDSREEFRNKIKMIGIGIGNSQYEVRLFREKYAPPFPLFDDRSSAVAGSLSGIYTPHHFGLKMEDSSIREIFYSESGVFPDAEAFLEMIAEESGIQRGGNS
jgi:hypothetical protein